MAARKRGLGRGLDALLSTTEGFQDIEGAEHLRNLPIDLVQKGRYQPRKTMNPEALKDLADSIRVQGVVQPILVRPLGSDTGRYEIVAGERRWRAAQMAGLHEVPAVVKDITDQTAVCIALIENIQREDLNPLEEANSFTRLIHEFGMTHEAVAEAVGRSRSTVTNILRLLELHEEVQQMLASGRLEMGHARAIVSLHVEQQPEVARKVSRQGLSVRETERLVNRTRQPANKKLPEKKQDPNIRRLQDDLSERLGAAVAIKHRTSGKGSVEIRYSSLDELEGILGKIKN